MFENKHSKYATFNSDFLSCTIDNEKGKIAFFGIESGGRDRDKHASYNLMLPGYGARFGAFKKKKQRAPLFQTIRKRLSKILLIECKIWAISTMNDLHKVKSKNYVQQANQNHSSSIN